MFVSFVWMKLFYNKQKKNTHTICCNSCHVSMCFLFSLLGSPAGSNRAVSLLDILGSSSICRGPKRCHFRKVAIFLNFYDHQHKSLLRTIYILCYTHDCQVPIIWLIYMYLHLPSQHAGTQECSACFGSFIRFLLFIQSSFKSHPSYFFIWHHYFAKLFCLWIGRSRGNSLLLLPVVWEVVSRYYLLGNGDWWCVF